MSSYPSMLKVWKGKTCQWIFRSCTTPLTALKPVNERNENYTKLSKSQISKFCMAHIDLSVKRFCCIHVVHLWQGREISDFAEIEYLFNLRIAFDIKGKSQQKVIRVIRRKVILCSNLVFVLLFQPCLLYRSVILFNLAIPMVHSSCYHTSWSCSDSLKQI